MLFLRSAISTPVVPSGIFSDQVNTSAVLGTDRDALLPVCPSLGNLIFGLRGAIDPIESRREGNQSDRVMVFTRVEREPIIQPSRFQLVEQFGERDGVLIKSEIIFVADGNI